VRRWCGFSRHQDPHPPHDPERVKELVIVGVNLSSQLFDWYECSDMDCPYTCFGFYLSADNEEENAVRISRSFESIRLFLTKRLLLHPKYTKCVSIPTDPARPDELIVPYPSILSENQKEMHKNFSETMRTRLEEPFFYFRGAGGSGTEPINTYPVIFAGFTKTGDLCGVYSVRCDT
jgi:hypothetical protein